MRKIKEVLRLTWSCGLSQREVAAACNLSRSTVSEYVQRARAAGLSWPLPQDCDDAVLEARLFTQPSREHRILPDWSVVERELTRPGVTRQILWEEYREAHPQGLSYPRFCVHYRRWLATQHPTMRLDHKAGEALLVDFAGQTMPITDRDTGEVRQAQIFVATLPASSYVYCEAVASQSLEDWLGAHVRTFEALGGLPAIVRPDNLRSGVTRACRYEPELNPAYADLARHYDTAVIPTRVAKPRDKAAVESHVLVVERQILARLRNRTFFSIDELNEALWVELDRLNARPMQKKDGSRDERFQQIDAPALKPLPKQRYAYAQWKRAKVHRDYHVELARHYYSVPYALVGERVEVRFNARTVEIFHRSRRVATHRRSHRAGGHTTCPAHMPKAHQRVGMRPEELIQRATRHGAAVAQWVREAMERRSHPEQGYRSATGVLRLAKEYGSARLNAACQRAIAFNSYSYQSVASMLRNGLERRTDDDPQPLPAHGNVRGPGYFH